MQNPMIKIIATSMLLTTASMSVQALTLLRGTETHLTGTLGDVQVNYVADNPFLTGYLDTSGLVTGVDPIPVTRVQYDVLNNPGNGTIFTFTVDYAPGTTVIGASDPTGFYDGVGTDFNYWGGVAYATLFDAGFGTYTYNGSFNSEWSIDYQADHITWTQLGNGFTQDTATGLTEFGFNPTFDILFDRGTILGLMPADVTGFLATGAPVDSTGMVLSAVIPVPAAVWLFGSGLIGLIGIARRK